MSSMERLWKDMELNGPCPEINPADIRRRVNTALNADPSERSIYMRQKIRMAAVMTAAVIALTGTALAVGTNWDALMERLGMRLFCAGGVRTYPKTGETARELAYRLPLGPGGEAAGGEAEA